MAVYNVSAGHNPDGKGACGAIGLLKESTENRKVAQELIKILRNEGHTVYDCTIDNGTSVSDVLVKEASKCNAHNVDLNISIHCNSGAKDQKGNGKTTGTEVLVYKNSGIAGNKAASVAKRVSSLGFANRGVKVRTDLYFLRKTVAPSILVECFFVDDYDDCKLYNYKDMARAIAEGILEKSLIGQTTTTQTPSSQGPKKYSNGTYNKKGKVIASAGLNVRSDRSTTSKVVTTIKNGTVLELNYCLNNWFSTYDYKYNGKPCYVCGDYIELL